MSKLFPGLRWLLLVLLVAVGAVFFGGREKPRGMGEPRANRSPMLAVASPGVTRPALEDLGRVLFTFAQPAEAAALDRALPAPTQAIHYVRLNTPLLAGKQSPFWQKPGAGRFELPLPEGGVVVVTIEDSEMFGPDRFTSSGRIEGHPHSRALFAWNEGFLHASIEDPVLGNFVLRTATAEWSQFYQIDPALVPPCGGERRPRMEGAVPVPAVNGGTAPGEPAERALAAENPQRAEVHVMMLYTQSVLPTMTGAARVSALQSAFDLAVAKVNAVFTASLITARVKLVRIAETRYDENVSASNKVQDDALTALYKEDDGKMDEIHALRDQAGADIVCLAMNRADSLSSGLSFLLDASDAAMNARFAFSVVQYSYVAGTTVVAHEFGHVFGCAHDRENALSGQGAFSFSYGYRFFGADGRQYRDIMSYPPGTELSYFSNPEVVVPVPVSVPIGIAGGQPGESNSALTIERMAFATAAYRLQTQTPPSAGTLINVATRAFVGTGDQVLIGGFVIQGSQPKRVLVRAAGPALAAFGVGDALADPVLRIFANGSMISDNDNWGDGRTTSASEMSAAFQQVGAFAFSAGSADAALLATLPPGAYSAVVEGVGGATGTGLVEAYEVESATTAKLVNIATRGYADRSGKEMHAGFVVQAPLGATKRMLIRVLGPTLSRAPFNMPGTLNDPEMEIRDATGELLLKNDDWSSQSVGGASPENDFRPVVELYGEKQIFATGFAPTNRREPAVLVDLPSGNFTVIVRPFESRNQPAAPGVCIVEVYEIVP